MENAGQDDTQPGQFQEVKTDVRFYDRTEPHLCPTCGNLCATTKIAQGLHKICTRVSCDECLNRDGIPEAIRQIARKWPELPQPMRDGILILLQSVLNTPIDT